MHQDLISIMDENEEQVFREYTPCELITSIILYMCI